MVEADPVVVVDDVHVRYQTFGGRRRPSDPDAMPWTSVVERFRGHVGAVTEVHAVRGVSFAARHGESIGVIGRNGSGKSTLLRAMAGLMPLASGHVYAAGQMSLLGVSAALVPQLTGARNIYLGCLAQGLTRQQVRERYDDIVEFAGIGDFVDMPMESYSSGMGARLRFAISTATEPDILVVDEALSTGDAEFKARSQERIEQIRAKAGTVFLVSHSARTVRDMCDRVLWMDKGQLIADGGHEILKEYEALTKPRTKR